MPGFNLIFVAEKVIILAKNQYFPSSCLPGSLLQKKTGRQDIKITINSIPLPPNYRRSKNLDVF
jgi:hypothetical protein